MNQPTTPPTVYLVDANLLLRLAQKSHPHHAAANNATRTLRQTGARLVVPSQAFYEFWVVATRPTTARGGLGLTPTDAERLLKVLEGVFPMLTETPLYSQWRRIVTAYGVSGKEGHDARLVAAMKAHSITHILTFNTQDFARYTIGESIIVIDPSALPAPTPSN